MQKKQFEIWNELAGVKTFTTPLDIELFSKYVSKDALIFDYGCGYGRISEELFMNGFINIQGADVASNLVQMAKEKLPFLTFNSFDELDFINLEHKFDAVILVAVLTTIAKNEAQKEVISNIKKLLKKDGKLYIADYLINSDQRNINRYDEYFKKNEFEYGTFELNEGLILRHHSKAYILQLLADFKLLEYYETEYTTMNANKSKGFQYFGSL